MTAARSDIGTGMGPGEPRELSAAALAGLSDLFGARLQTGAPIRAQHASTLTFIPPQPPQAVVMPLTTGEVQALVELARRHRFALIGFGAGTSLEGQVNAPFGGVSVDFSQMNRILSVSAADLDVTVEPGVTLTQLETSLRDTGLFFPVDPGAGEATLGGMASTRASGTTTVRFGAMRENVLALKVVMADGSLISTASRARKSAAGYDLTRLMVGAEGTLGLIVELTLKLQPRPEATRVCAVTFADIAAATETSIAAIQLGLLASRIELLDAAMLATVNAQSGTELACDGPALFVEFTGTPAAVQEHLDLFLDLARSHGARSVAQADSEDARRQLWRARHDCFWSVRSAWPGRAFVVSDVCVPISQLTACLTETEADIAAHGLVAPIVGHVGDGNFHSIVVVDEGDPAARAAAEGYLDRLVQRALRLGGTCSGEHGIGTGKACYLEAELGPAVGAMRALKAALDPDQIFNPGKIFVPEAGRRDI